MFLLSSAIYIYRKYRTFDDDDNSNNTNKIKIILYGLSTVAVYSWVTDASYRADVVFFVQAAIAQAEANLS